MSNETNEPFLTETQIAVIQKYWDDVDEAARKMLSCCDAATEIGGETVYCDMKPGHVEAGKRNRWISHRSLHRSVTIENGIERIILWGEAL